MPTNRVAALVRHGETRAYSDGEESGVQTTASEQMQRAEVTDKWMCVTMWRGQAGRSTSPGL